jgi:hypothetical protein
MSSTLDWSLAILEGLARSAQDGIAVWAGGGKGLDSEVQEALSPLFRELVAENPDARVLYAEESDSDEGDDRDVARWTHIACSGLEEGDKELLVEKTSKVACRFIQPEKYDDEEDDDGEPPLDVEGAATTPTWDFRARSVSVVGLGSHFDVDEARRADLAKRLRDAAQGATGNVRACLEALADAREGWKDAAYPSWCHAGSVVDVAAIVDALRPLMFALVIYQPDGDTVKVARIDAAVTHHDVPVGLAWSPALSQILPAKIDRGASQATSAPPARTAAKSPHREALFEALRTADRVGLKDQPAFQSLLPLSPAERRALLFDIGTDAPTPAALAPFVESIVFLLVELTVLAETEADVLELFAWETSLSSRLRSKRSSVCSSASSERRRSRLRSPARSSRRPSSLRSPRRPHASRIATRRPTPTTALFFFGRPPRRSPARRTRGGPP